MAKSTPKFPDFRHAFCAYYRCRPEEYRSRCFLRALHPLKLPFALPIYAFNKPFFAMDFMVIDSMGDARTGSEYELAMDELIGINRVERSIRRGLLRIRVSGSRLSALWKRMAPYVEAPIAEILPPDVSVVPQGAIRRRVSEARVADREVSPQVLRRLKGASEAITSGVEVAVAAVAAGFADEAEFLAALEACAAKTASARWLFSQLQLAARVRELEVDLARLKPPPGEKQPGLSGTRSATNLPPGGPG